MSEHSFGGPCSDVAGTSPANAAERIDGIPAKLKDYNIMQHPPQYRSQTNLAFPANSANEI